jgi:nucleoside-diphosphate-sugar epimerase
MRVLLTGGSGFIGRYVVRKLKSLDIDSVTLGRTNPDDKPNHICIDLLRANDFAPLIKSIRPTHLIHLAWTTEHGTYWDSKQNIDWIASTYRLLEAFCNHGGSHALIAGTCAEYDWRYGYCVEDLTPCNPQTLYGISKDTARRMCQLLSKRYGVPLTWARIFFPFGFGEDSRRLIPSLFRAFNGEIEPFGVNGNSLRDFIHIDDVVEAIRICLQSKTDGILNIGTGEPVKIKDIVSLIAQLETEDASIILGATARNCIEPPMIVADVKRLNSVGFKVGTTLVQALTDYRIRMSN